MGSHQSANAKSHIWLTPPDLLAKIGPFDLDPCAAPSPRPWPTAAEHYEAPGQDGLSLPWTGRVWLNPPYSIYATKWLRRLTVHNRGTALIFARTETKMFDLVWDFASAILFLRGRLHFHHQDGRRALANAGAPSVLIAYGMEDAERLIASGVDGHVMPLNRPLMLYFGLATGATWRSVITDALRNLGGKATLREIYAAVEGVEKVQTNPHWRAKVRQTLARAGVPRAERGLYELPALA